MTTAKNPREIVAQLRKKVGRLEMADAQQQREPLRFSSGIVPLDGLLPGGGLKPGTLLEWLGPQAGGGAGTLALVAAREVCRDGGSLVVIDRRGEFYPPAAARWGIDLNRMVLIRARHDDDDHWAWDQALRCVGARVVLGWPERLDDRTLRRWQLAAVAGGSVGLLVRSDTVAASPCWAEARLLCRPWAERSDEPDPRCAAAQRASPSAEGAVLNNPAGDGPTRRVRVQLLRCRGGAEGNAVDLEIDDETCVVRLVTGLAPAASVPRATGA